MMIDLLAAVPSLLCGFSFFPTFVFVAVTVYSLMLVAFGGSKVTVMLPAALVALTFVGPTKVGAGASAAFFGAISEA